MPIIHQYKFWFYVRKAIFQGCIPIILAFITFYGMQKFYVRLYLFTASILFIYSQLRVILEFIFSVCSDDILFKKEIDLSQTTPDLFLSVNLSNPQNSEFLFIVKKIFKLRYSGNPVFQIIYKLCWLMGIDSPVLIPIEIVNKLIKHRIINHTNEHELLSTTISKLYHYHPNQLDVELSQVLTESAKQNLINKEITPELNEEIRRVKKELFGINEETEC